MRARISSAEARFDRAKSAFMISRSRRESFSGGGVRLRALSAVMLQA
jgi:hypothetical protein